MITNGEFVSRVVNGIHALDKDSHVSRRWILNIGRTKAESYTAQRWDDGTLLGDHRLLTYVTCLEMIEVDKIVCCDAEFALCNTLMRSKHKLPGLLYSVCLQDRMQLLFLWQFAVLKFHLYRRMLPDNFSVEMLLQWLCQCRWLLRL